MTSATLTTAHHRAAAQLLADLQEHRLTVELLPAPRPIHDLHHIRVVTDANPSWYRTLCQRHPAKRRTPRYRRKPDTDIRRRLVERALHRLTVAQQPRYRYDWLLLPILERAAS